MNVEGVGTEELMSIVVRPPCKKRPKAFHWMFDSRDKGNCKIIIICVLHGMNKYLSVIFSCAVVCLLFIVSFSL